jgi:hypothetical protein
MKSARLIGGQAAHERRGAADRGEYCQAAGLTERTHGEPVSRTNQGFQKMIQ